MSFQVSSMLYRNCSSSSGNPAKEQEIYDEVQSRFDGYVTLIATTDEVEGEDYDGAVAIGGRQTFTAPAAILNDVAGEDFDPFAEHRISTIADREDEYRAMRWKLIISPERVDSFAEGGKTPDVGSRTYAHIICEQQLRAEEQEPIENEKPPNQDGSAANTFDDGDPGDAFNADIILGHFGKMGWFQIMYLFCIGYGLLFPTSCILINVFAGVVPAYRCFVDGCDDPIDPEYKADWLNGTALNSLLATPRAWRCNYQDFDTIPNATTPECAYKNYTVNATCHNWIFDKSVFTRTIVTDYLLVCDESWKITFGSSITMLGVLLGAFFLGPLPDLIGRRTSVVVLGTWMAAFGIGSCFAPNFDAFAGLRFLTGMGGVAVLQALIIWGLEAQAPVMRIKFICLIYCFQSIGNLISGLLAYFIRDWIILQLCLFVPMGTMVVTYFSSCLTIFLISILPESTRWLTVKKKYPEAKEIYENAAKLNKKTIPAYLLVISKKVTVDFPVAVHDMSVDYS
ncbi:hypothetical protein OUZ56_005944 [Daphnia magna]|uniref:Major facilitator superfamily (MFS) profile domain-containing protein n=1 Tax=Daphnia magna TaxID=35525 RepID=A0ABQ9YU71_9CRUS|nr:hypothetical protein OUZ56_005944 [Daphnia magna]